MRVFEETFQKGLTIGLQHSEAIDAKNASALGACVNAYPHSTGVIGYEVLSDMFSGNLPSAVSWPFPQLFRGKTITLLAYDDAIYSILNEDTPPATVSDWADAKLSVRDYLDTSIDKVIAVGNESWHFVDFGTTWMLIRPGIIVFKMFTEGLFSETESSLGLGADYVLACSDITMNTGCHHLGRMVSGGFDKTDIYDKNPWAEIWNQYYPNTPEPLDTFNNLISVDQNYVMWSTIGGGDILFLFFPTLALNGILKGYEGGVVRPPYFDHVRRNEMGYMPMNWRGQVLAVLPLGKDVIVYGEDGITRLYQANATVPTYGREDLIFEGIPNRGAVGGDDKEHLCVLNSGEIYKIQEGGLIERLDYATYFSGLTTNEIRISVDPTIGKRRYFICGNASGITTYTINQYGLSKVAAQLELTSTALFSGGIVGIYTDLADTGVVIDTSIFDLGNRGIKTIREIELGLNTASDMIIRVTVYASMGTSDSLIPNPITGVVANNDGVAYFLTSGVNFKIRVAVLKDGSNEAYEDFALTYIKIYYEQTDRKPVRGIRTNVR